LGKLKFAEIPDKFISEALENDGTLYQDFCCVEECSEFQKEVTKILRNKGNKEHLEEEIADLFLVLQICIKNHDLNEERIKQHIKYKIKRIRSLWKYEKEEGM
jgi:NTP pyrophosphatase (non-canonical NTP hydrolase)